MIILLMAILIIVLPVSIASRSESSPDGCAFKTAIIVISFFLMVLTLLLLVADYARAWQASNDNNACFKAIGFGFRQTFRTFFSSYTLMLILFVFQGLYGWLVLSILPGMKPVNEGGIIILFLISQLFFFFKILLKTWRYGSVTMLMELDNSKKAI
jgi:formate-dependent nitrite reductase membrane component NrfD